MPIRRFAWLFAWVVLAMPVAPATADIERQIRQMLESNDLRDTQVAVMVADLDTGRTLARIDAERPMTPASNMKLITTAAALDVLGPEFLFRTELELVDTDAGATLVVHGDGDPAFGDPVLLEDNDPPYEVDEVLEHWVQAATEAAERQGIERFERLVIDDRVFDRRFVHPTWPADQLNRHYAAEVAGINFHRNCIDIRLIPADRAGQAPSAEIYPNAPFIETVNRATTGSKDAYWFSRARRSNRFTFHGSVRNRPWQPTPVTVHDPPMFFGELLADRIRTAGVEIERVERIADDVLMPAGRTLHRMQTTLPAILGRVNRDSQNMFAEALLKRMGRSVTGAPGSWENGGAAIRISLRQRLGTDGAVINIADGSGLSRDNRTTAALLVKLLQSIHHDADAEKRRIFRDSLAVNGKSGTLEDRMADLDATVYAKSGYLRGVSALSGYIVIDGDEGEARTIAFSFLFNDFQPPLYNHQMKQLQNQLIHAIVERVNRGARLGG